MHLSDYQICKYVDNILNKDEEKNIREHLNSCKECFEKAFFLKRVLIEEEKFLTRKTDGFFNIIKSKIALVKDGIKLLTESNIIREIPLAFRNGPVVKAIEVMIDPKIRIFYDNYVIKIVPYQEVEIKVGAGERELFKGFLPANLEIEIGRRDFNDKFYIVINNTKIEFYINVQ